MNNSNSSKALGQFLKSRRERLQPEKVGIIDTSRRRTPGLRREEVAYMANVSATYYTWLEQGRDVKPSEEILRNTGKALQLFYEKPLPRPASSGKSLFELAAKITEFTKTGKEITSTWHRLLYL